MILLGIDAFYLVWLDFTLRKLELDHRLEDGYVSSFEEVITGHYINDMWPLHGVLLALGLFGAISLLVGILEYIGAIFKRAKCLIKRKQTKSEALKSPTTNASHESCNSFHRKDAVFMSDIVSRVPLLLRSSDDTNEREDDVNDWQESNLKE